MPNNACLAMIDSAHKVFLYLSSLKLINCRHLVHYRDSYQRQ